MSNHTGMLDSTDFADIGAVVHVKTHKIHEHESTRLIEESKAYPKNSGKLRIVLDFTEVEFVASAGLGAMITMSRATDEAGGRLMLVGVNDNIMQVMKLTKLDRLIKIEKDLVKAQKKLLK